MKKISIITLSFLSLLISIKPVKAENWVRISSDEGNVEGTYIDTDTVRGDRDSYNFDWLHIYRTPLRNEVQALKHNMFLDCGERIIKFTGSTSYDRNGNRIDSWSYPPGTLPVSTIVTNSHGHMVWKFLCQ